MKNLIYLTIVQFLCQTLKCEQINNGRTYGKQEDGSTQATVAEVILNVTTTIGAVVPANIENRFSKNLSHMRFEIILKVIKATQ